MAKKTRIEICNSCLDDFPYKELYIVNRVMHRTVGESSGFYRTTYCEKCIKDTSTYHSIFTEPKSKK